MSFIKKITALKKNAPELLEFMGYTSLNEFKTDYGFTTTTDALKYARAEYNEEVVRSNKAERESTIVNPLTGRRIKKYSVLNLDGTIRKKYIGKIIKDEAGSIIKNPFIIGIDTNTNELAKFNIEESDTPFLQQTFGFNIPKEQIKPNTQFNNIIFKDRLEPTEERILTIRVRFRIQFSEEWKVLSVVRTRMFSGAEIQSAMPSVLDPTGTDEFAMGLVNEDPVYNAVINKTIDEVEIIATKNNATMVLEDMILREAEPLSISNMYNEIIQEKRIENCIHDYMFKIYPKHSKSEKQKDKIRQLHTTNDIYEWCKSYDVKMLAYDINGNIIKAFYPEKKKKLKNMIYIAFNNHLYPLKNQYLNKKTYDNMDVKYCDNVRDKLIEYLENGVLPAKIRMNKEAEISSFIADDTNYTNNDEYFECLEILEKFGLKDKMKIGTKFSNLGGIIEELYKQDTNANSFFPFGVDFNKGAYNYNNEDIELEEHETFQTIDKVKCYSYELSQLPYLIKCDVKYHKSKKICETPIAGVKNPLGGVFAHTIIPHYLYIIRIDCPSLHLPNNDYFEGNTLIKARAAGLKFTILEEQETETTTNYFKTMISDLYKKLDNETFKKIINIHIGKFEMGNMKYEYLQFDKILSGDEINTFSGSVFGLTKNYSVGCTNESSINIFNKKPIAVQIKDRSRLRLFNMMNDLGLTNNDIKQVKTDSITFIKKDDKYTDYIHNELSGWKIEEFSAIQKPNIIKREPPTFTLKSYAGSDYKPVEENGTLALGNAGCGKTYTIVNEIIPKYKDDYIVLSPSHSTIKEYRKGNFNCNVIQKYTFSTDIPTEQNIIIDEIGMVGVSGWNMLVRCKLSGKNVMVYGDNTQYKPVKSQLCDNTNFYNLMFETQLPYNTNNFRNNFTTDYYNELKQTSSSTCDAVHFYYEKRLREVEKYNTNYQDADVILAYTHKTRKKYNTLMCEKYGINTITQVGAKIICKTNELREKNIYNKFCFEVVENNGDEIIISDGLDKFILTEKQIKKNFDYSYARTTHSVQGQTLNSFHFCIEDINWLDGRGLYTLISRLKEEIKE